LKSIKKDFIIDKDQVEHTLAEREILEKAKHPFLVSLEYAFQSEEKLFLIMNFQKGGELFTHLRRAKCFPEHQVKFYAT
jgi:serum/glucocorticoid-regulated kinase 2